MALVAEGECIEEVAGRADKGHTPVEVGGQQRPLPVDGVGETVAVTDAGDGGHVKEPSMVENPTVAITDHHPEVAVTETVIGHLIGQVNQQGLVHQGHVHDHILVAQVDACHQRAGTALLVLGEAIGRGLGVVCVVEDVVGIESVALSCEPVEQLRAHPLPESVNMH